MTLEDLNNEALLALHQETLAKARAARAAEDLDTAQRHLRDLRPINAEMQRRMAVLNARRVGSLFARA